MFGLGKGKIDLQLASLQFQKGGQVQGTATLRLKKPVEAQQFDVRLYAQERTVRYVNGKRRASYTTIYDFTLPLAQEGSFGPQSTNPYPFTIQIPNETNTVQAEGMLGAAINVAQALSRSSRRIDWYVEAKLHIKGVFNDVSKRQKINVT